MLIEYPITANYMAHWSVQQGVRELLQNALDTKECMVETPHSHALVITNTLLKPVTIDELTLFGESTKTNDIHSIGGFGEGFKLAMLVLARTPELEIAVHVGECRIEPLFNSKGRFCLEVWHDWALETAKEFKVIISYPGIESTVNKLLLSRYDKKLLVENRDGAAYELEYKVPALFVNGLYVCNLASAGLTFSYDFAPEKLQLDRDRNSVNDFNVGWEASKLWVSAGEPSEVAKMMYLQRSDVQYAHHMLTPALKRAVTADFVSRFGSDTKLALSNAEAETLRVLYPKERVVHIGGSYGAACSSGYSGGERTRALPNNVNFPQAMREYYLRNKKHMRAKARKEFEPLLLASAKK